MRVEISGKEFSVVSKREKGALRILGTQRQTNRGLMDMKNPAEDSATPNPDDTREVCAAWRLSNHRPILAGRLYGKLMGEAMIDGPTFTQRRAAARIRFRYRSKLRI